MVEFFPLDSAKSLLYSRYAPRKPARPSRPIPPQSKPERPTTGQTSSASPFGFGPTGVSPRARQGPETRSPGNGQVLPHPMVE